MEATIDHSYQCGYCYNHLEGMIQPKALSCGHVFCLPCLQNDYRVSPKLECIICRQRHQVVDLEALPSYAVFDQETRTNEDPAEIMSALTPSLAESKVFCPSHKTEELKLACRSCLSALCTDCFSADSKCSSGQNHVVLKMDELFKHLGCDLDADSAKLHERSSRMNELEKNILRLMEEKKKECEQMKAFVDKIADEQMKRIKAESEKLKSDVDYYYNSCAVILEQYIADLMAAKDHLEQLRKNIHLTKQQKQPSPDIIAKYSKARTDAEEELDKGFPKLYLPITDIERLEKVNLECRLKERKMADLLQDLTDPVPIELKFLHSGADLTKHRDSASWASVEWTTDGLLLCHTNTREVQCRDEDLNLLFSFPLEYTLAAPFGSNFVLVKFPGQGCYIDQFTKTFRSNGTIANLYERYVNYSADSLKIATCIDKISILVGAKVFVYSGNGTRLFEIHYNDYDVIGMKLFADYMLLLTSSSVYKLNCMTGSQREQVTMQLDSPAGMTTENARYIYVSCRTAGEIGVHSSAGKLKELGHKELRSVGGLSIKGNKLAVACNKEIKLFKLF